MGRAVSDGDPTEGGPSRAGPSDDGLWSEVVGQDAAVERLRASAVEPTHAYLLVGPEGSGTREAARAFAAEALARGLDEDAVSLLRRQVAAESHPALTVIERVGASLTAEQVRSAVVRANMAPPEGGRQVIVVVDLHLSPQVSPILLKTLEEPPESTIFVVLTEEVPAELATVASRCVRIDLGSIPASVIQDRLVAEGVDVAAATVAAASAGGSLTQARLLAADPAAAGRRALWYSLPDRLDGTGATAAALVDEVRAHTDELVAPLSERHRVELAQLDERAEIAGGGRAGERRALLDRHRREQKRVRGADLRSGLAALLARYRDAVADGGSAEDFLTAADAVQELGDRLAFNPNELLQLQALFVALPKPA